MNDNRVESAAMAILGSARWRVHGLVLAALLFPSSAVPPHERPRLYLAIGLPEWVTEAAYREQTQPDTLFALTNVTVIDGTGAPPMPKMTLLIVRDRIADIFADGAKPLPANTAIHELPGRFVIPGLIDSHVHIGGLESVGPATLKRVLRGGVTAVRDMGGNCRTLADLARRAERAESDSPDIYFAANVTGPAARRDPRYAALEQRGLLQMGGAGCAQLLEGPLDPARVVSTAKTTGPTGLKFYGDVTAEAVRLLTPEAHRQGLRVWAHATVFPARPDELVEAGVDVLSHASYLIWQVVDSLPDYHEGLRLAPFTRVAPTDVAVERLLRLMAQRGTVLDATLLISELKAEAPDSVTDFRVDKPTWAEAARWSAAVTRRARELGVPVAAGTDAIGAEHHGELPNLHRELELLVSEAGFSPLEAITAATRNGARAAGAEDTRGTIEIGKLADLVVLRADPSAEIGNTREIELVIKRGRVVVRAARGSAPRP